MLGLICKILPDDIFLRQGWNFSVIPELNQGVDEEIVFRREVFDGINQAVIVRSELYYSFFQFLKLILELITFQARSHVCDTGNLLVWREVDLICWIPL